MNGELCLTAFNYIFCTIQCSVLAQGFLFTFHWGETTYKAHLTAVLGECWDFWLTTLFFQYSQNSIITAPLEETYKRIWMNVSSSCTTFSLASSYFFTPLFNHFSHLATVWPFFNPHQHFNPHTLLSPSPLSPHLALLLMASFSWYHYQGKFTRWEESMECSSSTSASGRVFDWNHKQYCISYTIIYREIVAGWNTGKGMMEDY